MAGNTLDEPEQDMDLRILQVGALPLEGEQAFRIVLQTTRGEIEGILHAVEGGTSAMVCVGGAMGGVDGPAGTLYGRLPELLAEGQVTVLRLNYRHPNNFLECVLDTLAGCSFLQGIGATALALAGHSFGGAVVVRAGQIHPRVSGVVAFAPQVYGTQEVQELGKPLLLVHGTGDNILPHLASEDIYGRARDPKQIVLFEEDDHMLSRAGGRLDAIVTDWLLARFRGDPAESGRTEIAASDAAAT
ncbi:MAG: alpha/beta hydrolase [Dehalococcoidia bacterium]|nr:alpha/beta hydrolase [Dehalococcoidia bacterium]